MAIADKLTLLASSKEALRVKLGLPENLPFSEYHKLAIRKPFDPLDLFVGGKQGVWYDPSDKSTLFQDAAGTVPVTKDGDPVALMKDKSGNGNHAVQTVSTARPVYKTDGNLHWLQVDGVDDFLDSSLVPWNGSSFFQSSAVAITGGQRYLGTFRFLREGGNPLVRTESYLEEYSDMSAPSRKAVIQRYPNVIVVYDNEAMPARGTNFVSWNSNNAESFKTQVIPSQLSPVDMGVMSLASGNATLSLFRGSDGNLMSGRMYGFIWVSDNVSDENRDRANNYLMNKSGVTL